MSVKINDELKEKFIEFCNTYYPNKIKKDNRFNSSNWFYVQVGRFFSDYIHCEYYNHNIELHIEFNKKNENEYFSNLLEKCIPNLSTCKKQNHSTYIWYVLVPKSDIKNDDDLFEKMGIEINKINEAIEMSEFFIKNYFDK